MLSHVFFELRTHAVRSDDSYDKSTKKDENRPYLPPYKVSFCPRKGRNSHAPAHTDIYTRASSQGLSHGAKIGRRCDQMTTVNSLQ